MPARLSIPEGQAGKQPMTGWQVLGWFLGFFGCMFVVNGIFLWTAITTFPGEDQDRSYLAGIDYNQELARRAAQDAAGWQAEISRTGSGDGEALHIRLKTKDALILPALETRAVLRHPASRRLDQTLALTGRADTGYTAQLGGVPSGSWKLEITADIDPETPGHEFRATGRILIP
jgi:nitrogen fixation protein FixH